MLLGQIPGHIVETSLEGNDKDWRFVAFFVEHQDAVDYAGTIVDEPTIARVRPHVPLQLVAVAYQDDRLRSRRLAS